MKKKAAITNDYRAEGDPLKKFYLLERRNMSRAGSYTASHPEKYGTRGLWSLFDVIDNYADALDAYHNALLDYNMSRDYDWRLSVWAAMDGPDGAAYRVQTISKINTDQAADRSFLDEETEDAEKRLERESEDQFADLMSGATDNEADPEEKEEEQ